MKRTILTLVAGSLAAVTLGATAAHADEWRGDRDDQRYDQRYDRRDDGYRREREHERYERRHRRIEVRDGDRGFFIRF